MMNHKNFNVPDNAHSWLLEYILRTHFRYMFCYGIFRSSYLYFWILTAKDPVEALDRCWKIKNEYFSSIDGRALFKPGFWRIWHPHWFIWIQNSYFRTELLKDPLFKNIQNAFPISWGWNQQLFQLRALKSTWYYHFLSVSRANGIRQCVLSFRVAKGCFQSSTGSALENWRAFDKNYAQTLLPPKQKKLSLQNTNLGHKVPSSRSCVALTICLSTNMKYCKPRGS